MTEGIDDFVGLHVQNSFIGLWKMHLHCMTVPLVYDGANRNTIA